jgi:hypothetical protein
VPGGFGSPTVVLVNRVAAKEIRRSDDDELVGVLIESSDQWIPATVFGGELAPATSRHAAEEIVRAEGLASLADSWWLRAADGAWQEVWFLEVRLDRLRVNDRNPNYGTADARWVSLDEVDLHRHRPPNLG